MRENITVSNLLLFNKIATAVDVYAPRTSTKEELKTIDEALDWKNIEVLKRYLSDCKRRILPRKFTGMTPKQQRKLKRCVKIAKMLALIGEE